MLPWRSRRPIHDGTDHAFFGPRRTWATRLTFKLLIVTALVAALLLPLHLIESLIEEREVRQHDVEAELRSELGSELTLTGPLLLVPTGDGRVMHVWAEEVAVKTQVPVEPRYRGIFAVRAFRTTTTLTGTFQLPAGSASGPTESLDWTAARVMVFWSQPGREPVSTSVTWADKAVRPLVGEGCATDTGCLTAVVDRRISSKERQYHSMWPSSLPVWTR